MKTEHRFKSAPSPSRPFPHDGNSNPRRVEMELRPFHFRSRSRRSPQASGCHDEVKDSSSATSDLAQSLANPCLRGGHGGGRRWHGDSQSVAFTSRQMAARKGSLVHPAAAGLFTHSPALHQLRDPSVRRSWHRLSSCHPTRLQPSGGSPDSLC